MTDPPFVVSAGTQLPAEGKFVWRANGEKTAVGLQQGESDGVRTPLKLGIFRIRASDAADAPNTVDCHMVALPDGGLHFRAFQGGNKLQVAWAPKG